MLGKAFEAVAALVSRTTTLTKKAGFVALGGVVDKLIDTKLKNPACEVLITLSEAVSPQFVSAQLHKKAAAHKSPKVSSQLAGTASMGMAVSLCACMCCPCCTVLLVYEATGRGPFCREPPFHSILLAAVVQIPAC